jgi:hypothetical protein
MEVWVGDGIGIILCYCGVPNIEHETLLWNGKVCVDDGFDHILHCG